MKKFSELGIIVETNKNIYNVPKISLEEIVNCEIQILEFQPNVKTKFGEDRYVVKVKHDKIDKKFFTNSSIIKEILDKINPEDFPFLTVIKQQRFDKGSGKTFYFT